MVAPQSQVGRPKFGHVDNLLETPIENLLWVNVTPDFDQILTKRHDFEELPFQGFLDLGKSMRKKLRGISRNTQKCNLRA